jgi:hypothetical protein
MSDISSLDPNERREWMPVYAITIVTVTTVLMSIRLLASYHRLTRRFGLDDLFLVLGWALAVVMTFVVVYSKFVDLLSNATNI